MHMIRHQAVGMHRTPDLQRQLSQGSQEEQEVAVTSEAIRAIVSALHDVQRNSRKNWPGLPRHVARTGRRLPALTRSEEMGSGPKYLAYKYFGPDPIF
jgi:hypothetical protein